MPKASVTRAKPLNGGKGEAMGGKCKALRRSKRRSQCISDRCPSPKNLPHATSTEKKDWKRQGTKTINTNEENRK